MSGCSVCRNRRADSSVSMLHWSSFAVCILLSSLAWQAEAAIFGGYKLDVKYIDKAADGTLMTKGATSSKPTLAFTSAVAGEKYTVIMADPDAPSPQDPTGKWYLHWILTDAVGTDLSGTCG